MKSNWNDVVTTAKHKSMKDKLFGDLKSKKKERLERLKKIRMNKSKTKRSEKLRKRRVAEYLKSQILAC